MSKEYNTSTVSGLERQRIEALLFPITAFLRAGGLRKKDAEKIFSSLYDRKLRAGHIKKIEYIRHAGHYANIVARWTRDKYFVDSTGRPRRLPLRGKYSFTTLVQKVSPRANPSTVLSIFQRYHTVRRVKDGLCELAIPYFSTSTPKSTAFEPLVHFLSEASTTLGRVLTRNSRSRGVESFWRMVDNQNLSEAAAKKFTIFVRERSQTFLEEVDEWLEAHSESNHKKNRGKQRRVGLGLFSIYSNFNDWRQKSS